MPDIKYRRELVTKIIASYVSHHSVTPEQIPDLLRSVDRTIDGLGKPPELPITLTPAVLIRRSVQRDAVICLECGWKGKMLRRHLNIGHGLTREQYRGPLEPRERSSADSAGLFDGARHSGKAAWPRPARSKEAPISSAAGPRRGRSR